MAWRAERKIDEIAVAGDNNGLPVLYAVRGFTSVPDSNLEARAGVSEAVLRVNKYLGGSALHKTCKQGFPIYIERLVRISFVQGRPHARKARRPVIFLLKPRCVVFLRAI